MFLVSIVRGTIIVFKSINRKRVDIDEALKSPIKATTSPGFTISRLVCFSLIISENFSSVF